MLNKKKIKKPDRSPFENKFNSIFEYKQLHDCFGIGDLLQNNMLILSKNHAIDLITI